MGGVLLLLFMLRLRRLRLLSQVHLRLLLLSILPVLLVPSAVHRLLPWFCPSVPVVPPILLVPHRIPLLSIAVVLRTLSVVGTPPVVVLAIPMILWKVRCIVPLRTLWLVRWLMCMWWL